MAYIIYYDKNFILILSGLVQLHQFKGGAGRYSLHAGSCGVPKNLRRGASPMH